MRTVHVTELVKHGAEHCRVGGRELVSEVGEDLICGGLAVTSPLVGNKVPQLSHQVAVSVCVERVCCSLQRVCVPGTHLCQQHRGGEGERT